MATVRSGEAAPMGRAGERTENRPATFNRAFGYCIRRCCTVRRTAMASNYCAFRAFHQIAKIRGPRTR